MREDIPGWRHYQAQNPEHLDKRGPSCVGISPSQASNQFSGTLWGLFSRYSRVKRGPTWMYSCDSIPVILAIAFGWMSHAILGGSSALLGFSWEARAPQKQKRTLVLYSFQNRGLSPSKPSWSAFGSHLGFFQAASGPKVDLKLVHRYPISGPHFGHILDHEKWH